MAERGKGTRILEGRPGLGHILVEFIMGEGVAYVSSTPRNTKTLPRPPEPPLPALSPAVDPQGKALNVAFHFAIRRRSAE